ASATAQIGSSVAGFTVVKVFPAAASTASPLMMSLPGLTGASISVMGYLRRGWSRGPTLDRRWDVVVATYAAHDGSGGRDLSRRRDPAGRPHCGPSAWG